MSEHPVSGKICSYINSQSFNIRKNYTCKIIFRNLGIIINPSI